MAMPRCHGTRPDGCFWVNTNLCVHYGPLRTGRTPETAVWSRWLILRPLVEWVYRWLGKGPAPVDYVEMTEERRYCLERQGQGGAR